MARKIDLHKMWMEYRKQLPFPLDTDTTNNLKIAFISGVTQCYVTVAAEMGKIDDEEEAGAALDDFSFQINEFWEREQKRNEKRDN